MANVFGEGLEAGVRSAEHPCGRLSGERGDSSKTAASARVEERAGRHASCSMQRSWDFHGALSLIAGEECRKGSRETDRGSLRLNAHAGPC